MGVPTGGVLIYLGVYRGGVCHGGLSLGVYIP